MSNVNDSRSGFSEEIVDALNFDPFAALGDQGGEDQGQQEDFQSQEGQPQQPQQPSSPPRVNQPAQHDGSPAAPRVNGKAPAANEQAPKVNPVEQFMSTLQGQGFQPQAAPPGQFYPQVAPQQQPQPQQPQQAPQQEQAPDWSRPFQDAPVTIPPQLAQAIFSEDPTTATKGMEVLVGTIYNNLRKEMHNGFSHFQKQTGAIPGQVYQQVQVEQSQKALHDKFYGQYSELNTPIGKMAVVQIANAVAQTYAQRGVQVDPMNDDFLAYVADQAKLQLNLQGKPVQQRQAPRKQFQSGGGQRAGGAPANPFMDSIGF